MAVVTVGASEDRAVDAPVVVAERLEAFGVEVLAGAMNRPVQVRNGGLYLRGLIEQGARKSLEPLVERLGGDADYQSMQQFLTDSPWDPALVVKAVAEGVVPAIDVQAWVLDDTGFPKDGKDSPGVKRQYSGTLGKTGNCQIGVSVHAVGRKGTVPLGWALYLPEEWCEDSERRRKAKIPDEVVFKTKPELGIELVERAAGWGIARAPILGDCAYGKNTELRERLDDAELEYVLSVSEEVSVFAPETIFEVPAPRNAGSGPAEDPPAPGPRARADRRADRATRTRALQDGDLPRWTGRQADEIALLFSARPRRARMGEAILPATGGMADRRMAQGQRQAERLLALEPPRRHQVRAARPPRPVALEDRARLQATQGRARPGPLRGPLLARLVSPHRAGHRRARVPDPGAAAPKSPAAGLTLPQAVQMFQPLFKCWTGRCQTCQQPVDLAKLLLHRILQNE